MSFDFPYREFLFQPVKQRKSHRSHMLLFRLFLFFSFGLFCLFFCEEHLETGQCLLSYRGLMMCSIVNFLS